MMNLSLRALRRDPEESRIKIHGAAELDGMRRAGKLGAEVLDFITPHVVPGVTTEELDRLCHDFILDHGAIPAPLNYRGFPKSICTSINHVVCHGIPGDRRLMEGDIINIDVTVILDGWHGDKATASPSCAISAATASGASSMTRPRSCISARPRTGRCCGRACSSPSSRW